MIISSNKLKEKKAGARGLRSSQAKEQKEDCLTFEEQAAFQLVQEGQVSHKEAVDVEKEIFLSKESAAEEEIFRESVDEEEITLGDKVSLRREG